MTANSDPVLGVDEGGTYRIALLNGGVIAPTHDVVRLFKEDPAAPTFETATFATLEDLLSHLDASARRRRPVDVVLIGPGPRERFRAARGVRDRDGRVQIIFLASASELPRIRRAVLFNPLLSDMWSADVDEEPDALRTLARDAAQATRRRRGLRSALERINLQLDASVRAPSPPDAGPAASDRYLASLLTLAPDVIVSTDLDGRIVSWNEAAARTFGYSFDDAVGMPLPALFSRRPVAGARRLLRAVRAGGTVHQRQIVCQRADGSVFEGEVTLAPVQDEAGNRIGVSMIARDVSERVRERRELEDATQRLELAVEELTLRTAEAEAASRAKSELLAGVSHELRTPLQAIMGFASLLEEQVTGTLTQEQKRQVRRIHANADHLLALIDRLIDLSRSEVDGLDVVRRDFDLCAVVEEAADSVRARAESAGLALSTPDCPDPRLRRLVGDPVRVGQILRNLVSNAVKFTDEGSIAVELTLADGAEDPVARVTVRDTGIGLRPEEVERVFDPFFQARRGFSGRAPGLGLGLSISRRLAETMGGRLEVQSDPGVGSEFTLVLPFLHSEGD